MFTDTVSTYAGNWLYAAVPILVMAFFLVALWYIINVLTDFNDHDEILIKKNWAYTAQRLSIVAAQAIGMLPVITNHSVKADGWDAVTAMSLESLWVSAALLAARLVADKAVLYDIPNVKELLKGNLAVGVTEAGFYLGFGFILNGSLTGSLTGEDMSWTTGLLSTMVFGLLGLAVVVVLYVLHDRITRTKLHEGIAEGRVSAGIETAGMLTALGIIVHAGVAGDFTTWSASVASFFATVALAVPTLYVFRLLIDLLILRGRTIKDIQKHNQVVGATVLAGWLVILAFIVEAAVSTHL